MSLAVITLSKQGACVARQLAAALGPSDLYVHRQVVMQADAEPFESVAELTAQIFSKYCRLVYVVPCGVAVRAIAGQVRDKHNDPAVVAVDIGGRWAVSLLSGHEGGANQLAVDVANVLDAEPIISTTTEAVKTLIAGVGCRKGIVAERIVAAIHSAVTAAGVAVEDIRLLASADVKRDEPGLFEAARRMDIPLRLLASDTIRNSVRSFAHSDFVQEKVGLPAVAEPAALLAGRRTQLLLPRRTYHGVTVALAEENCTWSE
ncbi:MAG: cobalamin biosynthesis protein [Planctomycetota bacterium]|jgi:cobalt-precorrin 5A hydrolase